MSSAGFQNADDFPILDDEPPQPDVHTLYAEHDLASIEDDSGEEDMDDDFSLSTKTILHCIGQVHLKLQQENRLLLSALERRIAGLEQTILHAHLRTKEEQEEQTARLQQSPTGGRSGILIAQDMIDIALGPQRDWAEEKRLKKEEAIQRLAESDKLLSLRQVYFPDQKHGGTGPKPTHNKAPSPEKKHPTSTERKTRSFQPSTIQALLIMEITTPQ